MSANDIFSVLCTGEGLHLESCVQFWAFHFIIYQVSLFVCLCLGFFVWFCLFVCLADGGQVLLLHIFIFILFNIQVTFHRTIKALQLDKTFKIMKSNHQPSNTTMFTIKPSFCFSSMIFSFFKTFKHVHKRITLVNPPC